MDEYDEKLVKWFDDKLWPMIVKEHYHAEKMVQSKSFGQANPYWEGYFAALDMVNSFIDKGIEEIKDTVEKEDTNDD